MALRSFRQPPIGAAYRKERYNGVDGTKTASPLLLGAPLSPAGSGAARTLREARSGLDYATELAEDARERPSQRSEGLANAPLTLEELAARDYRSPIELRSKIKQARIELFGRDLSDSAISYRLPKRRERGERPCAEPNCRRKIPALANGRRRYCDLHGSGAARVRRHRNARAQPSALPRGERTAAAGQLNWRAACAPTLRALLTRQPIQPPRPGACSRARAQAGQTRAARPPTPAPRDRQAVVAARVHSA